MSMPSRGLQFITGKPWRRKAEGDPPELDYSAADEWVVAIHVLIGGGEPRRFVLDVQVDASDIDPDHPHAALVVEMRAGMVAAALNLALSHGEWMKRLPLLINPKVDHEQIRVIESINKAIGLE